MLIPVHHIVASSSFPIAQSTNIEPGYIVAIGTDGIAVPCDAADTGAAVENPIGLSADKNRPSEALEWQNRVSDSGQETAASGIVTVYHSGGEYWVDINDSTVETPGGTAIGGVVDSTATVTPGSFLYRHGATSPANDGKMDDDAGLTNFGGPVALIIAESQELETGIPGEFEPGATFNLSDDSDNRNFIKVKLLL